MNTIEPILNQLIQEFGGGTSLADTLILLKAKNKEVNVAEIEYPLNEDQELAWSKMQKWLISHSKFFTLRGFAGTGKTYLMRKLTASHEHNLWFSAPTNKATKVLSLAIGEDARTIYSILGLRMVENEDKKELQFSGQPPDLGSKPILVIDESSMIPSFLIKFLVEGAEKGSWRCMFIGDPAQLNPVGEDSSPAWKLATNEEDKAMLRRVMRFDNQLLHLSVDIRECLKTKNYRSPIKDNNKDGEGVFVLSRYDFQQKIKSLKLDDWRKTKVAVWRNKTVDSYNKLIREKLGFTKPYEEGDLILLASPYLDGSTIIAHTDEEFEVKSIKDRQFKFREGNLDAWAITTTEGGFTFYVPQHQSQMEALLQHRASVASKAKGVERKDLWKEFWKLKEEFQSIRHGYCLTSHRLQGSTYESIFLDQADILSNSNRKEAFRCLYVAATRPTKNLYTY